MSTPTGPAGGDLAGTYPDPTVPGLATLQSQITAQAGEIASLTTQLANVSSQLSTTQSNVATLQSDVALLQAQVAALQLFASGNGRLVSGSNNLDGNGDVSVDLIGGAQNVLAQFAQSTFTGSLWAERTTGDTWVIHSTAGSSDAGAAIRFIAF